MGSSTEVEEYNEDALPAYTPMPWSLKEIRAAIPAELFIRDTRRGLLYFTRDVLVATTAWNLATHIDIYFQSTPAKELLTGLGAEIGRWASWGIYWWFQGLIFTGIWVIGHEVQISFPSSPLMLTKVNPHCGHGAFSDHQIINDILGFVTHTFLWTPYFSWKISHHRHHSNHASMERDEVYVREDLGIPEIAHDKIEWDEIFGDTPIYTLYMLLRQQFLAFPAYLLFNVSGQKTYPKWTNHFDPNAILFTKVQRNAVIISNIGIAFMVWGVSYASALYSVANVLKYYFIPWLLVSHWFIMITYLHHTDPTIPHYRGKEWNFQRGAAATVDRPFLGWQGRFFLHDVAHFHVVHHFFPKMPFYHGPEATQYLKAFIGEHYAFSDKPVFSALWENYNKCQFVENEGDVLFYRDKKGQAVRRPSNQYRVESKSQ